MDDSVKLRRWLRLQWQLNIATGVFSAVAIGLAFARQPLLAQLTMIPVAILFIASCVLAYKRYQYNRTRRGEILAQLDAERDSQLRELFDGARRDRRLPPDEQSKDGYTAAVQEARARAAANSNLPPGVKRRGGSNRERP